MKKPAAWRRLLKLCIIYIIAAAVLPFACVTPDAQDYIDTKDIERCTSDAAGPDRAALLEDPLFSMTARIDLLRRAEHSIDIAYYTLHSGVSSDLFFAEVMKAADRGVEVRILLDGMFHNLRGSLRSLRHDLSDHPNIALALYEPFTLLAPWRWHNRLHDKLIIVDDTFLLTGGRNIGDKYYFHNDEHEPVYDRDVLIVSTHLNHPHSAVPQATAYFHTLWTHQYTEVQHPSGTGREAQRQEFIDAAQAQYQIHPVHPDEHIDWIQRSVPTNRVTLIHNPLVRGNKPPHVWADITRLIQQAEEEVVMQSPYIIAHRSMAPYADISPEVQVHLLTNSLASSPNYFAYGGMLHYRQRLASSEAHLHEYQGAGSIHGKTCLIDKRMSIIGAFNIDPRSAYLSTETMLVIDSEPLAQKLHGYLNCLIQESLAVNEHLEYESPGSIEPRQPGRVKQSAMHILRVLLLPIHFLL